MELKFLLLSLLVLFVGFGSIETKSRGGSRSSSSRSSSRSSSSRASSHPSSHGSSHVSSSHRTSSYGSSSHGSHGSISHGSSGYHSGSFLHSERGHSSTSSHGGSSSNSNPFHSATAPSLGSHGHTHNNSPLRPFGTVPPVRNTGNHNNNNSPLRPFGTVPPVRNTGNHNNNNSPLRPFGTIPSAGNTGFQKPGNPPPIGFVPPLGTGSPSMRPGLNTHHTSTGTHQPPVSIPGHNRNYGHRNTSIGSISSSPGINHGHNTRPGPSYGHNNRSTGLPIPSAPAYPTHYPNQGSLPSSVSGTNYPQQSPFNPTYNNPTGTHYSPYPGYHPTQGFPQQSHTHVYHHNVPSLPPNPAHTVVVVPGSNSYYPSRTTGDIFKEALIHAGVNAAVNRITSPHHYDSYGHHSWNSYSSAPPQGQSTVTTTNTHITNIYQTPGNAGNIPGGSSLSPNSNGQTYPGGGSQAVPPNGFNAPENYGNYGNNGNYGNYENNGNNGNYGNSGTQGSAGSPGLVNSQIPSNGQSSLGQNSGNGKTNSGVYVQNGISDEELWSITEKLFSNDENNATRFVSLNLQKQVVQNNTNVTDLSSQPLFSVHSEAYNIPTIKAIRSLYETESMIKNKKLKNSRKEEALLVDLILNTNIMTAAMNFLAQKNLIRNDAYEQKDALKHVWFTPYEGSSSGFKRVFQGEFLGEGILWGIQDWTAFDFLEKSGLANYHSYVQKIDLGKSSPNATILKINFEMSGAVKTGTALFVGTSPELEMALYTICLYTRPNNYCNVSLGGTKVMLYTHTFRYFGNDLIDAAFPIL